MNDSLMSPIVSTGNLDRAWRSVRSNGGGPGVDGVRLADFAHDLDANLSDLASRLREEVYIPAPLRQVSIPRRHGGVRELAIPCVVDRVAQRAFLQILEPIFEARFLNCSFGYRPGRGVQGAVDRVLAYRSAGFDWLIDADIQDFFPSVDHDILMRQLRLDIQDRAVLRVIGLWLESGAFVPAVPDGTSSTLGVTAAGMVRDAVVSLYDRSGGPEYLEHPGAESHRGRFDDTGLDEGNDSLWKSAALTRFGQEAARLAWDHRRILLPILVSKGVLVGGGIALGAVGLGVAGAALWSRRSRQGVDGNGDERPVSAGGMSPTGTPQGGPISPLLSNVYLHPFDQKCADMGLRLVRYADDFVICCASPQRARIAHGVVRESLEKLKLTLNPQETRLIASQDPMTFLGYAFDSDGAYPIEPASAKIDADRVTGQRPKQDIASKSDPGSRLRDSIRTRGSRAGRASRDLLDQFRDEIKDRASEWREPEQ